MHRETAVAAPGVHVNEAATGPASVPEYGKPKGKESIETGAEKLPKSPREEVRIPNTARPVPGPVEVLVPRIAQPQGSQEQNAGKVRLDRGSGNALPGNYGNFPTGKAYGRPMGVQPSASEVVQPQMPGGRTPFSEDFYGRNPDRFSGKGR